MSFRTVVAVMSLLAASTTAIAQPLTFSRANYTNDAGARGIVSADFNGDGYLDLATGNTGTNTVTILLNRGAAGSGFALAHRFAVSTGPFEIASADFNKDGLADLAVAAADADRIDVLLGKGDGDFWPPAPLSAPGNPRGLIAADINKDAKPDLVFTSYMTHTLTILNGDGTGAFPTRSAAMAVGANPQGVGAGDFNIDGRIDLIVANTGAEYLTLLTGTSSGGFTRRDIATTTKFNVLAVADMNRDGLADVVAVATPANYVAIFTNNYSTGLQTSASLAGSNNPRGVAIADLNKDDVPDIIVANRGGSSVTIWTGIANKLFKAPITVAAASGARDVVAGDFNHDGRIDLATGNETASTATVLQNSTSFPTDGVAWDLQPQSVGGAQIYGGLTSVEDFNHNGVPDFLTSYGVILDGTTGVSAASPRHNGNGLYGDNKAADFNQDGNLDVAVSTYYSGPDYREHHVIDLYLGDGAGNFTYSSTLPINNPRSYVLGDVNGDGHVDVVVIDYDSYSSSNQSRRLVFLGDGSGGYGTPVATAVNLFIYPWALEDMNRDGKLDLVVWNWDLQQIVIQYGDGAGGFPTSQSLQAVSGNQAGPVYVVDLNGDGMQDAATVYYNGLVAAWIARADGGYTVQTSNIAQNYSGWSQFTDFTGDGRPDLITAAGMFATGIGDGTFSNPVRLGLAAQTAVAVDFDRDGRMDLAIDGYGYPLMIAFNRTAPRPNLAPVADLGGDLTFDFIDQFGEEGPVLYAYRSYDPNLDPITWEWLDDSGAVLGDTDVYYFNGLASGTYHFTLVVRDDKGAEDRETITVTIRPFNELVLIPGHYGSDSGSWLQVEDPSAADGMTIWNPNRNTAKVTTASANPARYIDIPIHPDPNVEYKLWVRLKAENNLWSNDSLFMQFTNATNAATGAPVAPIGTTSALELNLEECSGCGISGWGWRDEAWGSRGAVATQLLKFSSGRQTLRLQTREDGVMIDQVVLSAVRYKSTRPGPTKNDNTRLAATDPWW